MSAPVDVLAIGVDAALSNCAAYMRDVGLTDAAAQIDAVNSAVAELTAAAHRARGILSLHNDRCPQLDAALALVGGAA